MDEKLIKKKIVIGKMRDKEFKVDPVKSALWNTYGQKAFKFQLASDSLCDYYLWYLFRKFFNKSPIPKFKAKEPNPIHS